MAPVALTDLAARDVEIFLGERTSAGPWTVGASELYRAFVAWCRERSLFVHSQTVFGRAMGRHSFAKSTISGGLVYIGLTLTSGSDKPHLASSPSAIRSTKPAARRLKAS